MLKSKQQVVWRSKGDLLVVLDTVSGHYYTLNQVAAMLWRGLFEKNQSLPGVVEEMVVTYPSGPTPAQIDLDCREAIAFWTQEGLVEEISS